jgi:drug/metabolite transporter (DMT)-like permease
MFKSKFKLAGILSAAVVFFGGVSPVLAQYEYEYNYSSNGSGWFGLFLTGCLCIFALAMFAFQIWMLIHAIKNAPEDQKVLWILLILLIPISSVIYFFTKKKEWDGNSAATDQPEIVNSDSN